MGLGSIVKKVKRAVKKVTHAANPLTHVNKTYQAVTGKESKTLNKLNEKTDNYSNPIYQTKQGLRLTRNAAEQAARLGYKTTGGINKLVGKKLLGSNKMEGFLNQVSMNPWQSYQYGRDHGMDHGQAMKFAGKRAGTQAKLAAAVIGTYLSAGAASPYLGALVAGAGAAGGTALEGGNRRDILKAGGTAAAGSALGSAAGGLGAMAGEAAGGGVLGNIAGGATQGAIGGLGAEALRGGNREEILQSGLMGAGTGAVGGLAKGTGREMYESLLERGYDQKTAQALSMAAARGLGSAGNTALRGGSGEDIWNNALIGGVSGGVNSGVSSMFGNNQAGNAAGGFVQQLMQQRNAPRRGLTIGRRPMPTQGMDKRGGFFGRGGGNQQNGPQPYIGIPRFADGMDPYGAQPWMPQQMPQQGRMNPFMRGRLRQQMPQQMQQMPPWMRQGNPMQQRIPPWLLQRMMQRQGGV